MSKVIKLRRGLRIRMKGEAERIVTTAPQAGWYAIRPTDFQGLTPKLMVKPEQRVKTGSPLFHDKDRPEVVVTSPASGVVSGVNRGDRRKILEVVVKADKDLEYEDFGKADPKTLTRDQVISSMLKSGVWPFIRQRPYGLVANPHLQPKAIFISAFDTAPLAPDLDFVLKGEEQNFQTGLDALTKLTSGKVHLSLDADNTSSPVFTGAKGVEIHYFSGVHPAGNVGIQIHHIDPINKGEVVWYVQPQDVVIMGRLFSEGKFDATRIIALTGSEVKRSRYYRTRMGASIRELVKDNVQGGKLRYISGNVLTGTRIPADGYIGFYDSHITVIPEGDHFEFLGWALPGFGKFSHSASYLSWLAPSARYRLDTNLNGGVRAYVMTGEYESVLPMDIYPVQLIKSILAGDIDRMENLGIYEVIEEDLALCEYVCTSKIEVQAILRSGIELMMKELG
jgi:Na+-transporting NADH:ubiquinone oxidoreductase subunit A